MSYPVSKSINLFQVVFVGLALPDDLNPFARLELSAVKCSIRRTQVLETDGPSGILGAGSFRVKRSSDLEIQCRKGSREQPDLIAVVFGNSKMNPIDPIIVKSR